MQIIERGACFFSGFSFFTIFPHSLAVVRVPMEVFRCLCSKFLVFLLLSVAASATDPYSEALLSLKSEFFDGFGSLSDWTVPSGEYPSGKIHGCSWSGIKCDKNSSIVIGIDLSMKRLGGAISGEQFHVFKELVDLNLSHNFLSGKLPVGIFNLTNLRSLDISRNNFSGPFPFGISVLQNLVVFDAFSNSFSGSLPVDLSELENLKFLNLAGSYFKGPIPSEYGSFKKLEFIHLAGNFLSGNLPPELGKLKTVTHMEIGYNSYQGSLPWEFGNMSNLQYLDIAGGNLSGPIPKELSNLTKLESLFLFKNQLTGFLPEELSRITSLVDLDLSDNHISGSIPESFSELKNLRLLSLMYNEMTGSVPKGIAELPSMETLLIWSNQFSGSLPTNLGSNRKLKWVDVSTNNFVGAIPPDICLGGVLFKLILFSNKFSGGLSPSLSNCSSLIRLRLEDNSFSGDISLKFSHLPDISYIDLSRNNFTGGIPSVINKASNLQYFNISHNPILGGDFPAETWTLPLLQNFSASDCAIRGNIPKFQLCKSISVIELNGNNLSGKVPESISSCQALVRMDLSENNLSGQIPEELAHLPSLSILDLSHNKFNGSIPNKFRDSLSLLLLNISFNDISGSIPEKEVFQSMGSSAFSGNPKLCGEPLRPCSSSLAILGGKGMGKLILVLIVCAGLAIVATITIAWIFFFRKGSKGKWKMVSFTGLPPFTANDILRSFDSTESKEAISPLSASIFKAVLPTGITVSVKKIEWEAKRMKPMSDFITKLGSLRHKNLVRLLGFCYNKQMVYLLYDYLPNGNLAEKISVKREWQNKLKLTVGIARGLHFLHHDCYPAIPHGDLKSTNIIFDENMEPRLAEFGLRFLQQLNEDPFSSPSMTKEAGEFNNATEEELWIDVHSFGEIILEILSNGRLTTAGSSTQNKARDLLLREIYKENGILSPNSSSQEEIKQVLDIALLCTRSRPSNRPSMEDVLKLLSEVKPQTRVVNENSDDPFSRQVLPSRQNYCAHKPSPPLLNPEEKTESSVEREGFRCFRGKSLFLDAEMSGWDEGGIYYSDQAQSLGDGTGGGRAGDAEEKATHHSVLRKFKEFIRGFEADKNVFPYRESLLHNPKFLRVDMEDVNAFDSDLPAKLRSAPADYLPLFETAAAEVLMNLKTKVAGETGEMVEPVPGDVQILLTSKEDPVSMRSLGAQYISKLVKISGITIAASRTKAKATYVTLLCKNCRSTVRVPCRPGLGGAIVPRSCNHMPQAGEEPCPLDPWIVVPDKSMYVDQQTLKLQENPEDVPTGELPRNMLLSVDRHLVQTIVPGTRLTIMGIYSIYQAANSSASHKGAVAIRQPYIRVVGIEESNEANSRGPASFTTEDIEEFKKFAAEPDVYKSICSKIAPSIFGHDDVKKAVACLLFGGSRKNLPDGVKLRGDINVLLLGDPSTAKSQFLKFVEKTAPVAVYTSGKGSSAAGLTASVIRDSSSREFYLEGGAMVLADGGVVCIDEFDKMRSEDRVAIHEAMEQQTISIAKAGITTVLNSRTSVLAAANPPSGRYDDLKTAQDNIDLQTTILSRFDLIFIVKDIRMYSQDKIIASHIIKVHASADATLGENRASKEENWLKRYIQYCRTKCHPRLTESASTMLQNSYVKIRQDMRQQANETGEAAAIPITVRQLEAIVRLSEALAKMKLSHVATEENVQEAIRLFTVSTMDAARSGIHQQVNLTPEVANEIKQAETQIKRRIGIGNHISERRLIDELTRMGMNESIVRRALIIMHQRDEVEYKRERRVIYRKA